MTDMTTNVIEECVVVRAKRSTISVNMDQSNRPVLSPGLAGGWRCHFKRPMFHNYKLQI